MVRWLLPKMFSRRVHRHKVLIFSFLLTFLLVFGFWAKVRVVVRDAIYLVRPIWDKPIRQPEIVIPHYYAQNINRFDLCPLHGWTARPDDDSPSVVDAVIFSTEIGMLEVRLRELWNEVDKFVVIETNLTFTGMEKPLYLAEALDRFKWAESKLVYIKVDGLVRKLPPGETPFYNEIIMRTNMGQALTSEKVGLKYGDLIIMSDVDEVPSAKTISLLKSCTGYPSGLHLQMRNYLYSYEFYVDRGHWRPHVHIYTGGTPPYHHQWASNYALAHAGWHCSFCFKYLDQFVFKMLSYSHADRVTRQELLDEVSIQYKICNGTDIFEMYPEEYTFRDLISKMGPIPKTDSAMDVPEFVVQNYNRFKYLLPGGCRRERRQ